MSQEAGSQEAVREEVWGPAEDPLRQSVARPYRNIKRKIKLVHSAITFVFLAAFVASGAALGLQSWIEAWTTFPPYVVALYTTALIVALKLLGLPTNFYSGFVIEHRFGLSNQTLAGRLVDDAKGFTLNLFLCIVSAEVLFWLLRNSPRAWWLWAAAVFITIAVVLANLAPVLILPLFYKFTPLEDEALRKRLLELCSRAQTRVRGVFLWGLSAKTKAANAALVGWGNTRRIILADNLLDILEPDEVAGVFAHELGHHVYGHIWLGIVLQSALTFAFFGVLSLLADPLARLQGLAGPAEVAMLPSILLLGLVMSLVIFPALCVVSRYHERQADGYALEEARLPEAYARGLERLCALNLADIDPPRWAQFIFGTHPAPGERIRRARTYAATLSKS
jgi:STE24 endopeptidase